MKKKYIAGIIGIALLPIIGFAQSQIVWSNAGIPLVDSSGDGIVWNSNWLIELYETSGTATINWGSDAYTGISAGFNGTGVDGYAAFIWNNPGDQGVLTGDYIYSVIWNNSVKASATEYLIVDGPDGAPTGTLVPATNPPWSYDPGYNIATDWVSVAVPEPSTYAMILVGLGLLAYRRRRA